MLTLLQALSGMTKGAAKMMESDPHGWTLTVVSVSVVFGALLILYFIYGIIGKLCAAEISRHESSEAVVGTDNNISEEEKTAAAVALAMYLSEKEAHEANDNLIISIRPSSDSWGDPGRNFRKTPLI